MTVIEVPARSVEVGDELVLARIHHRWPAGALDVEPVSTETVTGVATAAGTTTVTTAQRIRTSSPDVPVVVDRQ